MKNSYFVENEFYKDIYLIRRDNLILLAERYTSYKELKCILGISSSYTQSKKFLPKNRLPITKIAFKNELGLKFYKIKFFV